MCNGENPKQNCEDNCSCKAGIVIIQRATSTRWNVAILVGYDGLNTGGKRESNSLRSECDVIICLTCNCDVFGRDKLDP